jgi:protein ImuB
MAVPKDCGPLYRRQTNLSGTDIHTDRFLTASSARTKLLWLCLHFPELPLEIFSRADNAPTPLAISSDGGNRARVLLCNNPALAHGIRAHMKVSAAYALSANLIVQPRNEAAEQVALEHIAAWATQFTPMVSLVPPRAMVLEIGGSLALFAGLENLLTRLKEGLKTLGYQARLGIAPTPLGATWLARAGAGDSVTDRRTLRTCLLSLPMRVLDLSSEVLAKLTDLGLHCIGDCLRMPRDGLARRLGPQLLLALDQALGKAADARPAFVPPSRFASRLLLPAPISNCEALLFGVHRLLLELAGFLQARAAGIQQLHVQLLHSKGTPTLVTLRLITASRDAGYLRELLQVQLEGLQLSQPVEEVRLHADHIQSLPAQHQGLFSYHDLSAVDKTKVGPMYTAEWLARQTLTPAHQYQLVERLRARLGEDAVRGLCLVPEHRPERTYRWYKVGEPGARKGPGSTWRLSASEGSRCCFGARPLWLLVEPLPLKLVHGHPWLQGKLRLQPGPERIESGWWDGQDIRRDYFVAHSPKGSCFWIFRERRSSCRWFLHGIFA